MNSFFSKVFMWLFIGLLITFASGYYVASSESLLYTLASDGMYILFIIIQIVVCIFLSARIHKMQPMTAKILYLVYSLLTGITFASIFAVIHASTVIYAFLATALVFGIFALIGRTTKLDLSSIGTYALMGLIAVIILEIINLFLLNSTISFAVIIISIVVFIAFIAYDVQRLKSLEHFGVDEDDKEKYAIFGAFELYLDFINLFLDILKLFAKSRD